MDNILESVRNKDMLKKLPSDVIGMCEKGRFKLTKFISNTIKVLNTIPEEGQHRKIKNQDLEMSDRPVEKALGIHWNTENDCFFEPLTRAGVLSTIISIYYPLDIAAPFVLNGCQITQRFLAT